MTTELNIVIVEDSELLRAEMHDFLTQQGWRVHGVDCGEALSDWLKSQTPDIAILDVNLPYEDGYSIAARLRTSHPEVGVIMLSARVRHIDRSAGYEAGADVYLTKPSKSSELVAVIKNLTNRLKKIKPSNFTLGRDESILMSPNGVRCKLTGNERHLLELLALSPERKLEHFFILDSFMENKEKELTIEALMVLVSRLRRKCQEAFAIESIVMVERGFGYRLTIPISVS